MIRGPLPGRRYPYTGYPPSENEYILPDPGLTIAIALFCIVGPFWLIYLIVQRVVKKSVLFVRQVVRKA